jgi:hypothetical protein
MEMGCHLWALAIARKMGSSVAKEAETEIMMELQELPWELGPADALNLIGYMLKRKTELFNGCDIPVGYQSTDWDEDGEPFALVELPVVHSRLCSQSTRGQHGEAGPAR